MVLCAGLGTRLRPLTDVWPKPAVPLLGAPLVAYSFSLLKAAGLSRVGINTHHLPHIMESAARSQAARLGLSLAVAPEDIIQGTGGGIRGIAQALGERGPFVVLNGDAFFSVELAPLIDEHLSSGADATMVLLPMPQGETFGAVEVDANATVRRISGHGPGGPRLTPWHFSGVHIVSASVIDAMPKTGPFDINRDTYVRLMEEGGQVRGRVLQDARGYWSDVGTPERYVRTHRDLLHSQVATDRFGDTSPFASTPRQSFNAWAHASARLSNVRVSGPAWFGEGAVIEENVTVGGATSVGVGARVGAGASLNRVAVLDGAVVEPGERWEDAIVAPGGVSLRGSAR